MPITFYHCLHLISLIIVVSAITHVLLSEKPSKKANMILGIFTFLIFLAGFGLLAKLKLSIHSFWAAGKLLIWLIVSAGAPIVAKRFPHFKKQAYFAFMTLLSAAIILAFTKIGLT